MENRSTTQLIDRLFVPNERWGWEYVDPSPVRRNPYLDKQPVWQEPVTPNLQRWEYQRAKAARQLPKFLGIVAVLTIIGFLVSNLLGYGILLVGLVLVLAPVLLPTQRIKQAREEAAKHRELMVKQYEQEYAQWHAQGSAYEEEQWHRRRMASTWYPLRPQAGVSRVDVFGGTTDGWASMVATLGSSLLQAGHNILVLDFTEQYIAGELADFASMRNFPVSELDLPMDSAKANLLAGLDNEELAEVLAESVHTMRKGNDGPDLRALDAELLTAVLERLEAPPTFARIVAGVKVLRRIYDVSAPNGQLTISEIRKLTAHLDVVGQGERVQQQLQFLSSVLELLSKEEFESSPEEEEALANPGPAQFWPAQGLAVLATVTSHQRRKDFLDRLLVHRVLHELRAYSHHDVQRVLIVAGADHVGMQSLEAMARQARRSGVRLVLMLEHLREELQHLLGSSDSAAILMRLGNAKEATAAAEFIGRGYKFVLNQLTKSIGTTLTEGDSQSISDQDGTSDTFGTNTGKSRNRGYGKQSRSRSLSEGTSTSVSTSRSKTWQDSVNKSTAESTTDGETVSRVYEFAIEPTELQGLPTTAYILVEPGESGRRIVMGDCNPGISLLNRVANAPR